MPDIDPKIDSEVQSYHLKITKPFEALSDSEVSGVIEALYDRVNELTGMTINLFKSLKGLSDISTATIKDLNLLQEDIEQLAESNTEFAKVVTDVQKQLMTYLDIKTED